MSFPRENSEIILINSAGHELILLAAKPFLGLLKASQKKVGRTL